MAGCGYICRDLAGNGGVLIGLLSFIFTHFARIHTLRNLCKLSEFVRRLPVATGLWNIDAILVAYPFDDIGRDEFAVGADR